MTLRDLNQVRQNYCEKMLSKRNSLSMNTIRPGINLRPILACVFNGVAERSLSKLNQLKNYI